MKRSERQWLQLKLPFAPILRLIEEYAAVEEDMAEVFGEGFARMYHRCRHSGTVPLWWADRVTAEFSAPHVMNELLDAVGL